MNRFSALLLDSMNSRSAAGRNMKLQLMPLTFTSQKEKRTHCNKTQRIVTYSLSVPKTRPFRLTTWINIPSSILYLLPKFSIHYFHRVGQGERTAKPKVWNLHLQTVGLQRCFFLWINSTEDIPACLGDLGSAPILFQDVEKYFGRLAQQFAANPSRVFTCQAKKILVLMLKKENFSIW